MVSIISFFGENKRNASSEYSQFALVIIDSPDSATFLTPEEREYLKWIKSG